MELPDYEKNVKKVLIDKVHPNPWNPKQKNHKKVQDIEETIKLHGFKQPVQVRTHPTIKGEYEIIDGEQRWTAMKNLGATHVYIYDNGKVSDEAAKNETLWWQVQVPFETVELAHLVVELNAMEFELPYTDQEIIDFKEMIGADYKEEEEKQEEKPDLEFKTLTFKLPLDAYNVVNQALTGIKEDYEFTESRALEMLCADYLAGGIGVLNED